jgi:hypothetical protein
MSYDLQPAPPYRPNPPKRGPHYQAVVDNALRWLADNQPTPDGIRSVLHDYPALCKILYRDGRDILGFNDAHKILTEVAAGRLNPAAVKEAADRERERADLRTIAERIKADAAPANNKPKTKQRQAVTQSDRTEWTLQALEKVAAIWVAWRRNHNTHKMGGRERDCFEKHKDTLPVCIKTAKDFQNCKECARKHGLIPKHNRKRRKSAG